MTEDGERTFVLLPLRKIWYGYNDDDCCWRIVLSVVLPYFELCRRRKFSSPEKGRGRYVILKPHTEHELCTYLFSFSSIFFNLLQSSVFLFFLPTCRRGNLIAWHVISFYYSVHLCIVTFSTKMRLTRFTDLVDLSLYYFLLLIANEPCMHVVSWKDCSICIKITGNNKTSYPTIYNLHSIIHSPYSTQMHSFM